ncbi:MAG TPA: DNA translocase FtsK [Nitrospirales bacterium]|jgi:S-DNA-T family DNA segregation ATPase FtsK/SpoIIIE
MGAGGKSGSFEKPHEIVGVVLLTLALLLILSLVSYSPHDPVLFEDSLHDKPTFNLVGRVGMTLATGAFWLIGGAAYMLPVALGVLGGRCFLTRGLSMTLRNAAGFAALLLFLSGAFALHAPGIPTATSGWTHLGQAGGSLGIVMSDLLIWYVAPVGAHIVVGAGIILSLLIATPVSLVTLGRHSYEILAMLFDWAGDRWRAVRGQILGKPHKAKVRQVKIIRADGLPSPREETIISPEWPQAGLLTAGPRELRRRKKPAALEAVSAEVPITVPVNVAGFVVPSAENLLTDLPASIERLTDGEIQGQARVLTVALANFGINGQVIQTHVGPVVTMYEFEPAPGVKVARIVNLSDDLALALKAMSIRIVAPIPGKSVVGIEVPNPQREDVSLKQILLSEPFVKLRSPLKLALGKDIFGDPVVADLRGMPHLLVAGATGSGKSVGLNTMILSLLFSARPDEVKFLMIDPKMLELTLYEGIPHLWRPVITEPKAAARGLLLAVREMERRYKMMAEYGARNIESYNRRVAEVQGLLPFHSETVSAEPPAYLSEEERLSAGESTSPQATPQTPPAPLPYLVIVIDELADLMMVAAKEVEDSIARLAQMARAAGIHLILATQRPSVDVITGIIKANFPARIAFQVASKTDSRTVLDQNGADQLLGRGDMLYLATGSGKLTRVHGALVPDLDLARVVEFIKGQSTPAYADEPVASSSEGTASDSDHDDFYEKAKEIVMTTGQVSASFLQRRLRIGYPRAARLVELMEQEGIVGPPSRDGRREVLIKRVGVDEDRA